MRYFYLSKEYAKNNGIWIYKDSDTPIKDYMDEFGIDAYEYIGNSIPNCPWYDEETDSVMEMPYNIRVLKGITKMKDGEYIDENNNIVFVEKPCDMIKPIWDLETRTWSESLTEEEIYVENINEFKNRFFNYFEAYKKIIELSKFGIIQFTELENKNCLEFLDNFNPNKENVDINYLIEIEQNVPEIIKKYL